MKSYQPFTYLAGRIDADGLYNAVTISTRRSSDLAKSLLTEVKHRIDQAIVGPANAGSIEALKGLKMTDEVLKAIRGVALSYRYDIRSEGWRLERVEQLIEEVNEALEANANARRADNLARERERRFLKKHGY